ncbi:MAG: transposase [Sphingobacterium sp.]
MPFPGRTLYRADQQGGQGKKGVLLATIKGTVSERIISILEQMPNRVRKKVKEIVLDLAPTMERIARRTFPHARLLSDRFHVQQLRIEYRWEAIEQENKEPKLAKEIGKTYTSDIGEW